MFELSYSALLEQVETIVQAATLGESLREHFARPNRTPQNLAGIEAVVERTMPSLLSWSEYDHCANVTRLYSVFEVFMSAFVRDVCEALPRCIRPYSALPPKTRKAHRVGVGKIILEIEEKTYHKQIVEQDLVESYLHALTDRDPYKLSSDSFLVRKNALRFSRISELLEDLGFADIANKIGQHSIMQSYLPNALDNEERRKTLSKKIEEFIDLRNEASHAEIESTWRVDRLRELAYFVRDLGMVLVEIGEATFTQRNLDAGLLPTIGTVATVYRNGDILIVPIANCTIAIGDEIILNRAGVAHVGSIKSIEVDHVAYRRYKAEDERRVGIQLTVKGKLGDTAHIKPENIPEAPDKLRSTLLSPVKRNLQDVIVVGDMLSTDEPDEPDFDEPDEPDFDEPDEPDFDEPDEPDFDEPDEPDFDEPDEPDFDEPDEPDFDEPDEPDFDEPDEPDFDEPDEPDFDEPDEPDFDEPDEPDS